MPPPARDVCRRDDKVDALHRSVFRILLTHMMEDPHMISNGMELFLVSRNLERVADLATNIAEDVVFLVEGKSIKHHSEDRGDSTSVTEPAAPSANASAPSTSDRTRSASWSPSTTPRPGSRSSTR